MEARRVHLDLDARLESLPGLHTALEGVGEGLDDEGRADLALLAVELVTNAIRHSHAAPAGRIGLDVVHHPGTVRVEVRDPGPGFHPEPATPTSRQLGGRGLFLVEQLADRWGHAREEGLFLVWAEIWAGGRTRHRRVAPRMLAVGEGVVAPPPAPIPSAERIRAMSDADLKDELNLLAAEERGTSRRRRHLHAHIDALRIEVAHRLETPRSDPVLSNEDLAELARVLSRRMPAPS